MVIRSYRDASILMAGIKVKAKIFIKQGLSLIVKIAEIIDRVGFLNTCGKLEKHIVAKTDLTNHDEMFTAGWKRSNNVSFQNLSSFLNHN